MKEFKRITALCSTLLICLSVFSACGKKGADDDKTTTAATVTPTSAVTEVPTEAPTETPTTTTATTTTTTTAAPTTTATTMTEKPSTTTATKKTTTTTKKTTTTTKKTTTTTKKTTTTTKKIAPTTKSPTNYSKAEMIAVYNKAINKVITSKAGYTKTRTTNLGTLEGAEAIMKIKVAKDAVYGFLGVGTKTYTNSKGSASYLSTASLKDSDIKSAKCEKVNGDVYKFTFTLADGASSAPNGSDSSPLQRCGLLVGSGDKSEYDHKNAANIYTGINNADGASVQSVKETTSGATVVAQIDVKTGKLISLNVKWNWNVELAKVKYAIVTINGKGKADSAVSVSNIKW